MGEGKRMGEERKREKTGESKGRSERERGGIRTSKGERA